MDSIINNIVINNWQQIDSFCIAIYSGGSTVDPVINNPHDFDYICFAKPNKKTALLNRLAKLGLRINASMKNNANNKNKSAYDFSQVRVYPYTQITWFSYLDILMEKVIGEDICPKTDIIYKHRAEFIAELQNKMKLLLECRIKNNKRWYHLLRGAYIIQNNSYAVTEAQKKEINILHDLSDGWEAIRDKTIEILKKL